jgi:pantetheine-phosphate adenylyltransferase
MLELDTEYGPTITNPEIDALVTSQETSKKGLEINDLRLKNGLKPLKIVVVNMIKAEDGMPISSSRIRTGHIDTEGKVLNFK